MDNKFIQYKLWSDCSNNCRFCMNQLEKDADKIDVLDYYIGNIVKGELDDYNELGIQGGEFFNGQLDEPGVRDKFYQMIDLIVDKINQKIIRKFDVTTSLIYKDLTELFYFIDYISSRCGIDCLLICTSYDTIYRFHNSAGLKLWENAIFALHERYPQLKIHCETIITQDFINKVLSGEHDIAKFAQKYRVHVDYLEPFTDHHGSSRFEWAKRLPMFYPTRESFVKFLEKVAADKTVDLKSLFNRHIRSHTAYILINGKPFPYYNRQFDQKGMGGIATDPGYIDSDISMNYDVMSFRSLIE